MTSTMIRRRWSTRRKAWRYEVRYRLGGREARWRSCGTFSTKTEADDCLRWARAELAAGRVPDRRQLLKDAEAEQAARVTVHQAFTAYHAHRLDVSDSRRSDYLKVQRRLGDLGTVAVADVTEASVLAWRDRLLEDLQPRSARQYIGVLAQVLDHAKVDPNPARGDIPVPRQERRIHRPPTMTEVAALISGLPEKYRLPVRVLRDTGMRVGELRGLTWEDLDGRRNRIRVLGSKTHAATRWVTVTPELVSDVLATRPPQATASRPVFPGITGLKEAMARTCRSMGLPHMHPHLLRHMYASRLLAAGMDPAQLAQALGHAKKSVTLDTYSWVIDREGDSP